MATKIRSLAAAAAGIIVLALSAACQPVTSHPAPGQMTSASAPPAAVSSGAPPVTGAAVYVHDPGRVTGTVPSGCHVLPGPRPDPRCTPGGIDPGVTQANIHSTICVPGYTAKVRPPASETDALKWRMYVAYSIQAGTASELDHLDPLELGGDNDTANLWIEAGTIPNKKDAVEGALNRAVCDGRVSLAAAQAAIVTNWTTAEQQLGLSHRVS